MKWDKQEMMAFSLLAAALGVSARTFLGSLEHGAWFGAAVVAVLAVISVVGLLSLHRVRHFLLSEQRGLTTRQSTLLAEIEGRLGALAAQGIAPEWTVLRERLGTQVRGRGYLGRYFVAVTILVGLVGTFAGLMTTLRGMGPMLAATDGTIADVFTGPLSGLDVTFGSSIVAILATLALTLAHGEILLLEDSVFAAIDDLTVHTLIPALWPQAQKTEASMLTELELMRRSIEHVPQAVAHATKQTIAAQAASTDTLAGVLASVGHVLTKIHAGVEASAEATRAQGQQLASTLAKLEAAHTGLANAQATAMKELTDAQANAMRGLTDAQNASMRELASSLAKSMAQLAAAQDAGMTQLTETQDAGISKLVNEQASAMQALVQAQSSTMDQTSAVLAQVAQDLEKTATGRLTTLADTIAAQTETLAATLSAQAEAQTSAHREALITSTAHAEQVLAQAISRTLDHMSEHTTSLVNQLDARSERAEHEARALTERIAAEMKLVLAEQSEAARVVLQDAASREQQTLAALGATYEQALTQTTERLLGEFSSRAGAAIEELSELGATLEAALTHAGELQRDAVVNAAEIVSHAVDTQASRLVDQLLAPTEQLAEATRALAATSDVLRPTSERLASDVLPQLGALGEQVGLLAARNESSDLDAATLTELSRLSDGMDELRTLLAMARGEQEVVSDA